MVGHLAASRYGLAGLVNPHLIGVELQGFFVAIGLVVAVDHAGAKAHVQVVGNRVARAVFQFHHALDDRVVTSGHELLPVEVFFGVKSEVRRPPLDCARIIDGNSRLHGTCLSWS